MKQFSYDPALVHDAVRPRARQARFGAILIEGATLFALLVLASMVAVMPVAVRFLRAG